MKHIFILFIFLSAATGSAQSISIPKIKASIQLDGLLEETAWDSAFVIADFKQLEPELGKQATEQVVVKVFYDAHFLYIAGSSNFSDPSQMFAATLERDIPQLGDDYLEIHLDTYNDKINTLVFRTNALSARQDFEVSRNGQEFNTSWNTFWDARSAVGENGWSTEIKIPFSSLRYERSAENIMRIKAIAKYKEKNELLLSPLVDAEVNNTLYHFSNAHEVTFKNLPAARPLYVTPYVKGNIIHANKINGSGNDYEGELTFFEEKSYARNVPLDKILSNIGMDVKYKPNANHSIDLTFNTDFAEIEADDRIVNISRFPIFLEEKRLFFLENADLFNSNQFEHRLFHSRRIGIQDGRAVPIIGGLRFTGGNPDWQYGMLSMQTHTLDESSPSTNMSVVRVKKNVGKLGSYIGILNTNKSNAAERNHLFATDANISITNNIRTQFSAGVTFDEQSGNWKPMYGAAVNTFKNNGFGIEYRFREYTKGFNPELGFVEQPNTRRLVFNHGWRRTYSDHNFLRYLSIGHYFTKNWLSDSGRPDFFQTNIYFNAIGKKGNRVILYVPMYQEDNLYSDWAFAKGVVIPRGRYVMWKTNPIFIMGNAKRYRIILDTEFGDFYGGSQFTLYTNISFDVNQYFKAELGGSFNRLKFPDSYTSEVEKTINLSRYFSRLKFSFSSKSSLNSYLQYDSRADKISWNLRFRYNPVEGTDLYVVYNHNANTNRHTYSPELRFTDYQVFTIKFSKTFLK